jgi:ribokinase
MNGTMKEQPAIAVLGSINMDIVVSVKQHPLPGETIHGSEPMYSPGGKGANQAVAAAKSGIKVKMAGAVGTDGHGRDLMASLDGYGVDTGSVAGKEGSSGLAFITVDEAGENCIILSPGANGKMYPEELEQVWPAIEGCSAVLLQNEIPLKTTLAAMKEAAKRGQRVYFNPAPAVELPENAYAAIHCLILNETEADTLIGGRLTAEEGDEADAEIRSARALVEAGVESVVLTLGAKGAIYADKSGEMIRVKAFAVEAVDTTAAGDTFIGAFAAMRESGETVERSLRYASAAAALTVTKSGAQQSIPVKEEVELFLEGRSFLLT